MNTIHIIFLFPFIITGLYALAQFIEYHRGSQPPTLKLLLLKLVGLYGFGMLCILPNALRHNQDNLYLFWHANDFAFLDEYLTDNFSNFVMAFPILLMLVYLLETLFPRYKIQPKRPKPKHLLREFILCISSMVFFAPSVFLIAYFSNYPWYHMYHPLNLHSTAYFIFSVFALLVAHEVYFYLEHRFMHYNKWFYRHVHHTHHLSHNPTVFSTYALHPIEALLSPMSYLLMPFILPVSYEAMVTALLIAEFFNIMGHHGCEWFPGWFAKAPILKYLNRATFHNMHHSHGGRTNFGYYTIILDRCFGTLHKNSEALFENIVSRRKPNRKLDSDKPTGTPAY